MKVRSPLLKVRIPMLNVRNPSLKSIECFGKVKESFVNGTEFCVQGKAEHHNTVIILYKYNNNATMTA